MGFKILSHSFHKSFKPVKRVSMQIYNIFRLTFDNIHLHAMYATDNILLLLLMHAANSVDINQILMLIVYIKYIKFTLYNAIYLRHGLPGKAIIFNWTVASCRYRSRCYTLWFTILASLLRIIIMHTKNVKKSFLSLITVVF